MRPDLGNNEVMTEVTAVLAPSKARQLLAFARSAEPRSALSAGSLAGDVLFAALVAAASLAAVSLSYHGGQAAALVTSVPLAARRRFPLAAFLVVVAGALATKNYATDVTFLAIVIAGYSAAVHSRFRGAALLALAPVGVLVAAFFWRAEPSLAIISVAPRLGLPGHGKFVVPVTPGLAGLQSVAAGPLRVGGLLVLVSLVSIAIFGAVVYTGDRIRRLQGEHEAATRRALRLERSRIASELHDVVTHNVSVMIVQAGAARQVLGESQDDARQALLAVEASGRAAMTELRHLLGLLSPVPGAAPAAGESQIPAPADLEPQPGLGQLRPLIDRVAAAGLPVTLELTGGLHDLPPGLDLAAFRVVQEGLTNVIKHAGRAPACVTLGLTDTDLVVDVANEKRPAAAARPGPGSPGRPGRRRTRPARAARADRAVRRRAGCRPASGRRLAPAGQLPDRAPGGTRLSGARGAGWPATMTSEPLLTEAAEPPRVVIADDQALVRGGFRMILGAAGIPVVAEAADGAQAVAAVLSHRPDVVLMDIRMPDMDGLEATRRIVTAPGASGCRVIILTTFDLDQYVYASLTAGASGFLLKDVSPEQLVAAVRMVREGDALLAPSITRRLIERFAPSATDHAAAHGSLAELTPRELEVLQLLARGLSNAELAAELTLSEATVKTHVARILAKLQLRDRVQAVVLAYESGLVGPGRWRP